MDAAIAVTTDDSTKDELSRLREEMQQLVKLTEGNMDCNISNFITYYSEIVLRATETSLMK